MRISVAMCTFNGQAYLPRQLRSLTDQDRPPDDLVIFDDGSTDQTAQIIRDFAAVARFEVRWQVNSRRLGVTANFASAVAAATGDIIACCDQDDVWYPEKLAAFEAALADGGADMVFSDADLVDDELRPLGPRLWESIGFGPDEQRLCQAGRLWSVLVRFNAVTGAGMAFASRWRDLLLPIPARWTHDGWMAMLLSIVGRCRCIEQPLWSYRRHARQQIGPGPSTLRQTIAIARRMDHDYFQLQAANFAAVMNRLSHRSFDMPISLRLWDKIVQCRSRALMRGGEGLRPLLIATEWMSGRYSTCALGWKSLAQDIWLAGRSTPPRDVNPAADSRDEP